MNYTKHSKEITSKKRQLDLKDVLSHLLGPIPWALAEGD